MLSIHFLKLFILRLEAIARCIRIFVSFLPIDQLALELPDLFRQFGRNGDLVVLCPFRLQTDLAVAGICWYICWYQPAAIN